MTVNLAKGEDFYLSSVAPGLIEVVVGLGWEVRDKEGGDFDLDASALMVAANRRVLSDDHFIYFNNRTSPEGAVIHQGDNLTGDGEGDDEKIRVSLNKVPADVDAIVFTVTIYKQGQTFGQIRNAFVRLVNCADGKELVRYDLREDFSVETAIVFGELYRDGAAWKFRAVGQGRKSGLIGIAQEFGVLSLPGDFLLVPCPACGIRNRVFKTESGRALCGSCKTSLMEVLPRRKGAVAQPSTSDGSC